MKQYKLVNNSMGWVVFILSAMVYIFTIEPTASFWDCGEFIATCFKLEVGHPPGNPIFMIMGRFFTLFAGGNIEAIPVTINIMSALVSAGTILFLFWTITHIARRIIVKEEESIDMWKYIAIMGAGFVGAMGFAFTDSFWFSAVEAEVYASSSFFTAIVVWAIFRWENVADQPYSNRWIVLIAFLMGLSIGVHLLNLLAIPAIVFVYYFKKYEISVKAIEGFVILFVTPFLLLLAIPSPGIVTLLLLALTILLIWQFVSKKLHKETGFKKLIQATFVSMAILIGIMYVIIPYTVKAASWFELMFVNGFGFSYNSGMIFYCVFLTFVIAALIFWTLKKKKVLLNTIMLCVMVILLGYSAVIMIVIRSNANPPLDENNPENAFSLLAYLNREQYGDRPLFYGQFYNAPVDRNDPYKEGDPNYVQLDGRYEIADHKMSYNYEPEFCTVFPRMWSPQKEHVSAYKSWGEIKGTPIQVTDNQGKPKTEYRPTFAENLRYFWRYQVGFMYFRYFMWNFSGRQNDIQGHGGILKGNWITGITPIDKIIIGPQKNIPESMKNNKGTNKYYLLPLLLGLIGLVYTYMRARKDFIFVMLLFFFTGIAIVLYLNQYPYQPRERDYSMVGSFYAFAIWIGLGIIPLVNVLRKKVPATISAGLVTIICTIFVPGILAKENWDDHDRSHRYTSHDFAVNYLNSCAPNAIIFTNGDNDTFPLWYAQEVEGIRTDVRVVNLSLFNTDWYIEQMKRKAYDSDPIPSTLEYKHYMQGQRDIVFLVDDKNSFIDEKYKKNPAFETSYQELFGGLQKILSVSKFPEMHKADYEKILKGHSLMNLLRFKSVINGLAQKTNIEKYNIQEESINNLRTATDKLIDAVAKEYVPVKDAMNFIANSRPERTQLRGGNDQDYCPTKKFSVPADPDLVIKNGTVSEKDRNKIVPVDWSINKNYIMKAEMMVLDILAANNWKRPIYFAITVGSDSYMSLEPYFQLEGFAYRLVPLRTQNNNGQIGRVNADIMYDNMMNKFKWGNMNDPRVYLDENNVRMIMNLRNNFARLADQLITEGDNDRAMKVLDKCEELIPDKIIPYNYFNIALIDAYYKAKAFDQGNKMLKKLSENTINDLSYYFSVGPEYASGVDYEKRRAMAVLQELVRITRQYKQDDLNKELDTKFNELMKLYTTTTSAPETSSEMEDAE